LIANSIYITLSEYEEETHPFPIYVPDSANKLILGTFPTKKSLRKYEFFYPNTSNRFWNILASLADTSIKHLSMDDAVIERKRILKKLNLAIWDMGAKVLRQKNSSLDGNLFPIEYSNIFKVLDDYPKIHTLIINSSSGSNSVFSWLQAYCKLNKVDLKEPKGKIPKETKMNVCGREIKVLIVASPSGAAAKATNALIEMYKAAIKPTK
jgi:hypoxanthine-DNA glycosylase